MTNLSAEALRELKALAEKASSGPWAWEGRTVDDDGYVRIPECSYLVGCICLADTYEGYQKDCDYIAAASPDILLALLAERERLLVALECAEVGMCAVGVPHKGERAVLQECVDKVRAALAAAGEE